MNAFDIALSLYKSFGREAAKRFLTPSKSYVKKVCDKSHADLAAALEERDEAVEETLEFIESMLDKEFVDPDEN